MSDINKKHDDAVRETRQKVAAAVANSASDLAKKSTGWRKVVLWVVAGAATVAAWWFGVSAEQSQPETAAPVPAVAPPAVPADEPADDEEYDDAAEEVVND